MDNFDSLLKELDRVLEEQKNRQEEAKNEQTMAEEMKAEAVKKEAEARARLAELEQARIKASEAQAAFNSVRSTVADEHSADQAYANTGSKKKSGGFFTGLVVGVAALSLLIGGFKLLKDVKSGEIRTSIIASDTRTDEEKELADKYGITYDGSVATVKSAEYVELTTEEFETLLAKSVKSIKDKGITLDEADIIKFVTIVNIDKLSQDNPELLIQIIGDQNPDQVKLDAQKVMGALEMYNYNQYFATGNRDGFILASEFVFDANEQAKLAVIEERIAEIALAKDDKVKMNELIHSLFIDMLDPQNELSYLESGVGFGAQLDLEPIRGLYGLADDFETITLDDTNKELVKYFVPYSGDEQEYEDNNLLNGYIRNINDLLSDCQNKSKTLSK